MKLNGFIVFILIMVTGCSNQYKVECVSKVEEDTYDLVLVSVARVEDKKITMVSHTVEYQFNQEGEEVVKFIFPILDNGMKVYDELKGVDYTSSIDKEKAIIKIVLNLKEIDKKEFEKVNASDGMIGFDTVYNNIDDFKAELLAKKFSCKKK